MPRTKEPAPASNVPKGIVTAYARTIEGKQKFWFSSVLLFVGYSSLRTPVVWFIVYLQALVLLEIMNLL
jgi:hypothetical protein